MGVSNTYREVPVTFEKGMVSQFEDSTLPEASAALIENWVPEEHGGLRVREGWKKSTMTGGPATSKGLGLGVYTATRRVFRQRASGTQTDSTSSPVGVDFVSATRPGSTLVLKWSFEWNGAFVSPYYNQSTNGPLLSGSAMLDGWEVVYMGINATANGWGLAIKQNSPSTTSAKVPMSFTGGAAQGAIAIEAFELTSVSVPTPKNLLPHAWIKPAMIVNDFLTQSLVTPGVGITSSSAYDHGIGWRADVGTLWTSFQNHDQSMAGFAPHSGNTFYKVQHSVTAEANPDLLTLGGQSGIPATPNQQYTGSIWLRKSSTSESMSARLKFYNAAGTLIQTNDGTPITMDTSWKQATVTATAPASAAFVAFGFVSNNASQSTMTMYWDDPQLELGGSVTAFDPIGRMTSPDIFTAIRDVVNPVTTVAGATSSAAASWAEATIFGEDTATTPSAAGWTNAFTEGSDVFADATSFDAWLASSSKIIVGSGQNVDTAATVTNIPTDAWASILTLKLTTSSPITLDQLYVAANDATSATGIHYISQADIDAGSWGLVESVSSVPDGSPTAFATGLGVLLYTNPGFAAPRRWAGIGDVPVAIPTESGTCVAFFKSRFFIGGPTSNPTRLLYSDIGSFASWPSTSFLEVGEADGYTITDVATQENYLIIGKGNSIYSLSGSGPDTFFLYRFPTGDAAPGRSVCVTPQGAVVAGKTAVWSLQGTAIEDISANLGALYDPAGFVHTAYNDGKVYILDQSAQKVFVYNQLTKGWHIEKFTSANNQLTAMIAADAGRVLASPLSSTDTGLIMYRNMPSLTRTRDFSPLTSAAFLRTPMMWIVGPRSKATVRWLFLQIRQRGNASGQITLKTFYDNASGVVKTLENKGSGARRYRVDLGTVHDVSGIQFEVTGPDNDNQFDIEDAVLGFDELEVR